MMWLIVEKVCDWLLLTIGTRLAALSMLAGKAYQAAAHERMLEELRLEEDDEG